MRILLDTHVYLWWLDTPVLLSKKAVELIENPNNIIYISAVVSWEISIKVSIGKLNVSSDVMDYIVKNSFIELPITVKHTQELLSLENLHKDPFDRILLAQAKNENLTFITCDSQCLKYKNVKLIKG